MDQRGKMVLPIPNFCKKSQLHFFHQAAPETPLSTPSLLARRDSSAHDLTQFAAHAVAYERKLAGDSGILSCAEMRLTQPGKSALAKRRVGSKISSSSEDDVSEPSSATFTISGDSSEYDIPDMSTSSEESSPILVPTTTCGAVARFVSSAADAVSTKLGFGMASPSLAQ